MVLAEKKTMVLTYIDENYEENLEFDFIKSLRECANYKGKVVVLNYGINETVAEYLAKQYDVDFVNCKKDLAVFSQRYRDIPDIVNSQSKDIENVMLIDGGDVWFQKSVMPIFEATADRIGCVEESSVFGADEWTDKCMANLSENMQDEILKWCKGTHVKNSGMIAGPRNLIVELMKNIYVDICNSGIEYFGIDQILFNYEYMKLDENIRIVLDNQFNFVLVTNKEGYEITKEKIYRKQDNMLVTVVHNAGGAWRMLKRPFKNKNTNYDQYILENVNQLNKYLQY